MDIATLLKNFAFDNPQEPVSLYKYAPVYRVRDQRGDWVIKRTGLIHSSGTAIGAWLLALIKKGINIVAPVEGFGTNPRILEDGNYWVIYPYIENSSYNAFFEQIEMSGMLLGRIHATATPEEKNLKIFSEPISREKEWIDLHAGQALKAMRQYAPHVVNLFTNQLKNRLNSLSAVKDLPVTGCIIDFKASNLAFSPTPILIDPDHAACMPRLADVANALLLFHCDLESAPARLWSVEEWKIFLAGYSRHISLTSTEKESWQQVLNLAWLNEGIWLLGNFPEGWADVKEAGYLTSLATIDLHQFVIE